MRPHSCVEQCVGRANMDRVEMQAEYHSYSAEGTESSHELERVRQRRCAIECMFAAGGPSTYSLGLLKVGVCVSCNCHGYLGTMTCRGMLCKRSAAHYFNLQSKHQKQDAAAAQRNLSMKQQLYALRRDQGGPLPSPLDIVRKAEVGAA